MEHEYKVGDWVQIVDVDEIAGGEEYWENGDVCEVKETNEYDGAYLSVGTADGDEYRYHYIDRSELHAIQPFGKVTKESYTADYRKLMQVATNVSIEVEQMMAELERQGAIDRALDSGDKEVFLQLTQKEMVT